MTPNGPKPRSRFEPIRKLGGGPKSEVWVAYSRGPAGFARPVVIKRGREKGEDASRALAREARAYARLSHPAIVRMFDFVEDDGRPTMVLEHVDGLSLGRLLELLGRAGEGLDDRSSVYVGARVFLALASAHQARDLAFHEQSPVVHGDVSPWNVVIPWDGYAKLCDFSASPIDGDPGERGLLRELAPEVARGDVPTLQSDVYSACFLLRELLLGPVEAPSGSPEEQAVQRAVLAGEGLEGLAKNFSSRLSDALRRGLAVEPSQRVVSADAMVTILREAAKLDEARDRLLSHLSRFRQQEEAQLPEAVHNSTRESTQPTPMADHVYGPSSGRIPVAAAVPTLAGLGAVLPGSVVAPAALEKKRASSYGPLIAGTGLALVVGVGVGIGAAGRFGAFTGAARTSTAIVATTSPPSPAGHELVVDAAVRAPVPAEVDAGSNFAEAAVDAPATGTLVTDESTNGRRVLIDGVWRGNGVGAWEVRCGQRVVQIGANGKKRPVVVPCGGRVSVSAK